jgi:hypothetical protein
MWATHTLDAYTVWLRERYADLDALNRAWHRRHALWDEVPAGRQPNRSYVETIAFHRTAGRSSAGTTSSLPAGSTAGA